MKQNNQARQGVFISYARTDGEAVARALHARLSAEARDIPAWLDRFEIEGGVGWWNQIEQEIDRAEFLMLVMTPVAMRSENTRREWRSARQRGVCVYPVKGIPDVELDFATLPNWMRKAHFYDPEIEWQKLIAHLRRGCRATRVPFMAPPLPASFVARPRETEALLDLLLAHDNNPVSATAALRGPGGFGKTTLAAAICHDDRCIDAFDDGILWVTLGQSPNVLNELIKLYAALTGERPGFVDVEDAARELALRLENKNCLIVIDDAWSGAHVRPFLPGGAGCAQLITTRLFEVALDAQRIDIDQMTPAEALQLLLARTGVEPSELEPFRRLGERLGQWPLPIKLAGSAMRQRLERGDTLAKALEYVVRALDKRGITAFDKVQASEREDAVARTIGASLDLLTPEEQQRCAELTIFRADEGVPIGTAATLWQLDDIDSEDLARKLDELALIEFDLRLGMLHMHDVLRGFLTTRLPDVSAVHGKLLDAWGDPYRLPDGYAWRAYTSHMRRAGRDTALQALLLDVEWLEAKLRATGIHSLIPDFEHAGFDRLLGLLRDALRLSAPTLAADREQLRSQLVGRLLVRDEPEIVALREAAALRAPHTAWLRLLHPTLDAPGGMLLMTLTGHGHEVTSLAIDADYRRLVSASNDGTVRVWDARDGELTNVLYDEHNALGIRAVALIHSLAGHSEDVTAVAVSADGSRAISGSEDHTLRVWNVGDGVLERILEGHTGSVNAVALTGDRRYALSGSNDRTAKLWEVDTGACLRTLTGHEASVVSVALAANGWRAITGCSDRSVKLWDLSNGMVLAQLEGHSDVVRAIVIDRTGTRAATGSVDRTIKLWRLDDLRPPVQVDAHAGAVVSLVFSPDGRRCASGGDDGRVKVHDVASGHLIRTFDPHPAPVRSLAFTQDGSCVLSDSLDDNYRLWIIENGESSWIPVRHGAPVDYSALSPTAQYMVAACADRFVYVWDVLSGALIVRYGTRRLFDHLITAAARRRDLPQPDELLDTYLAGEAVYKVHIVRMSPDGSQALFSATTEDSGSIRTPLRQEGGVVGSPVRTGACLLALNIDTGEIHSVSAPQTEPISAFAVDAGRTRVLWARQDHALELWDLQREKRITTLRGHSETVNAVGFSGDGTRAFSCGRDRTLRVWDLASGETLAAFTADAALRSLALSADDGILAAGDMAGRIHFLRLVAM